jgi:hypothetical protein
VSITAVSAGLVKEGSQKININYLLIFIAYLSDQPTSHVQTDYLCSENYQININIFCANSVGFVVLNLAIHITLGEFKDLNSRHCYQF